MPRRVWRGFWKDQGKSALRLGHSAPNFRITWQLLPAREFCSVSAQAQLPPGRF